MDGGFAGEARLARLRPRESQLLFLGKDLDVEIELIRSEALDTPRHFVAGSSELGEHYTVLRTLTYRLANRHASPRDIYLRIDVVDNSAVTGDGHITRIEAVSSPVAIFAAPAESSSEKVLTIAEGLQRAHAMDSVTPSMLADWLRRGELPKEQADTLEEARQKLVLAATKSREAERIEALRTAAKERALALREDLRALAGHRGRAADELTARLLAAQDEVAALARRAARAENEARLAKTAARKKLKELRAP